MCLNRDAYVLCSYPFSLHCLSPRVDDQDGWTRYHSTRLAQWEAEVSTAYSRTTYGALSVADTEAHGIVCAALSPGVITVHYARKNVTMNLPFTQGSTESYRIVLTGNALFFLSQCVLSVYDLGDLAPPLVTKFKPPSGSLNWNALRRLPDGSVAVLIALSRYLQVYRMAATGRSIVHSSTTAVSLPRPSVDVYGTEYLVVSPGKDGLAQIKTVQLIFVPLSDRPPKTTPYRALPLHVR